MSKQGWLETINVNKYISFIRLLILITCYNDAFYGVILLVKYKIKVGARTTHYMIKKIKWKSV